MRRAHRGPHVHLGPQGIAQDTRAPPPALQCGRGVGAEEGSASSDEEQDGVRQGMGAGDRSGEEAKRSRPYDALRARLLSWAPGQAEALQRARDVFSSPTARRAACRVQQTQGVYDETLPLSPYTSKRPWCSCRISTQATCYKM